MRIKIVAGLLVLSAAIAILILRPSPAPPGKAPDDTSGQAFAGSSSCRECHGRFYQLWSTSHHGLAMQPCTPVFFAREIAVQDGAIVAGEYRYRVAIADGAGQVLEEGPDGPKSYKMLHAMGGKNTYFFLTPMEKGRLQVLPLSYNIRKKEWYDTTKSMLHGEQDQALHWTDPLLTFNTSCYNCHVSQLSTNYDPATESYQTTWNEPGINCETCHNAAQEHVRVCRAAPKGQVPADLKITRFKDLSVEQTNSACAICHAKSQPLDAAFRPQDLFFDHADLITLEHEHYHPDGRDSGENYTYTSWLMSPCVKAGKLTCVHCHTSSGRYRFQGEKTNQACAPCHQQRVEHAAEHHHHPAGKPGSNCVDCHMPMTSFAQMNRSDHSMRPPMPGATLRFKSPNACNLCHQDKDARWSEEWVRKWHKDDYQAATLRWAELIEAGRKSDWKRLPEMLEYLKAPGSDDVVRASLLKLCASCPDARVEAAALASLKSPSPLVRAAASFTLGSRTLTSAAVAGLLDAAGDPSRAVRVRAGAALDGYPLERVPAELRKRLAKASEESLTSLTARQDQWSSHYNLGNHFMRIGDAQQALAAFERAIRLRPDVVPPLVNAAILYAQLRQPEKAGQALRQALQAEPKNAAANFNLGLLLAEKGDRAGAAQALRRALESDPRNAAAAYNLGVLSAETDPAQCLEWCRKAWLWAPDEAKYAWTLGFYLNESGQKEQAIAVLEECIKHDPAHVDVYLLLGRIHESDRNAAAARAVYERAAANGNLPPQVRAEFTALAKRM